MIFKPSEQAPMCPVYEGVPGRFITTINLEMEFSIYSKGDIAVQSKLLDLSGLDFDSYDIYECSYCHLHFSDPLKSPSGEWYAYTYNMLGLHASERWGFSYLVNEINHEDIVGEIGCGTGIFLGKCKDAGVDGFGIDFSESSVIACREKGLNACLTVINSDISYISVRKTVIASFHVHEHLENPSSLFDIANNWAAVGASLWVAVPSDKRINRYRNIKDIFDEPPHHLTRWTKSSLEVVGRKNGWTMVDLIYEAIGLKQRLWCMCITSKAYVVAGRYINTDTQWKDRLLRYALYPFIIVFNILGLIGMTGDSMLVEYIKDTT